MRALDCFDLRMFLLSWYVNAQSFSLLQRWFIYSLLKLQNIYDVSLFVIAGPPSIVVHHPLILLLFYHHFTIYSHLFHYSILVFHQLHHHRSTTPSTSIVSGNSHIYSVRMEEQKRE